LLKRVKPDIVLLDATTPDSPGANTVRQMMAIDPQTRILILSMDDDEPIVSSCLKAGALGYVRKDEPAFDLKLTINRACGWNVRAA
jgi:DNA-binding NarL/FixJ family response regulator